MSATVLIKNTHTATVNLPAVPRDGERAGDAEKALPPGCTPLDESYWERVSRHPVVQSWLACGLLIVVPIEMEAEAEDEAPKTIPGKGLGALPPLPEVPHA